MMIDTINVVPASINNTVLKFISANWVNILLIIVGTFALLIYILQERRKVTEAASLVILQIDELQDRIKEIQSFIVDRQLNETAFYESQILFVENYWNRYKHYFVKKIDAKSFRTLNSLYDYASEIQDQQQLMKNLQKNYFFVIQQTLANLETSYIISGLNNSPNIPADIQQVILNLNQTILQNVESSQKVEIEKLLHAIADSNGKVDFSTFWKNYNQNRSNIRTVIDQKGVTSYSPIQIRMSLEKALNQYSLLEVNGCDGFKKLQKISERKF